MESKKGENPNRVKMSVPNMGFSVLKDNERAIAMIEAHQRRQVRLRGALALLYISILFFYYCVGF
ncbi:hypothetical protein [Bacillus sp. RS11]|uniref:hypothetical protein n=1 Tax=Lysinibacillus sp. RS11 TaxID=3242682 RepID=UPI0035C69F52